MKQFTEFEVQVLREVAREIPPSPWGAALGEVLESLKGNGYITSHFGGTLTEKGKEALAVVKGGSCQFAGAMPQPPKRTDTERLQWLEEQARKSHTGISFDWVPAQEGERSGWRFMRRHFISEQKGSLREAIDAAIWELRP